MSSYRLGRHLSVVVSAVVLMCAAGTPLPAQTADGSGPATFIVMLRGTRVGTETVSLSKGGNGWTLTGTGRLGAPFDIVTNKFEVNYGVDWQPSRFIIQGLLRGQALSVATSFGLTTALNEVSQAGQRASIPHQISSRALVLPSGFFASYEALAARAGAATPGTRFPVYVAPDGETSVTVEQISPRRISFGDRNLDVRVISIALAGTTGASNIELWVDERNRLARLEMPAVSVIVIRDDLASVMAREEHVRNSRDEDTFIPANGFSLGATTTAPANARAEAPAVILVAGIGPQDRDFTSYGVPIFGQIAGTLSDAGFFVVRYDPRGVGRSGGRTENATLAEYADDVVRTIAWLRRRPDVDDNRIAVVGYGDGGPVAMLAGAREGRIKAIALVAAPGRSGREVTIEQQTQILARLSISETERATRVALQHRVIDATLTGNGWETIPREIRIDADTPWFKSWLQFDPAATFRRLKQPVLIVHGGLDKETPPTHADALERLSSGRNKIAPTHTRKVVVPSINHLLVPASTGDVAEYAKLDTRTVSPAVGAAIAEWLATALPRPK